MDELLADLDEFLALHHLPSRQREICSDVGMMYDMGAALPDDETLMADDRRERFRLEYGAIVASFGWTGLSGTLA